MKLSLEGHVVKFSLKGIAVKVTQILEKKSHSTNKLQEHINLLFLVVFINESDVNWIHTLFNVFTVYVSGLVKQYPFIRHRIVVLLREFHYMSLRSRI